MPIWLRKFTYETISEYFKKQQEELDKQENTLKNQNSKGLSRPNIAPKPTYTTKATKK